MTSKTKNQTPFPLMLIGVGGFGTYHLAAINTLCAEGRIRLVAVADPAIERLPQVKEELEAKGIRIYSDYNRMLESEEDCTAVTIAAPIPFHHEIATACLKRDLWIYLEKPPVPLISQLETLIDLDKKQRVFVGFQHLCLPWMQQLKSWIINRRFGELLSIHACACWTRTDAYYQRSGWSGKSVFQSRPTFDGPATNALAHLIHNIMYLASPCANEFLIPSEIRGELYRARRIESYDVASLCGKFSSGTEFSFAATHATQCDHPFELSITGTKEWAKVTLNGGLLETSFAAPEPQAQSPQMNEYLRNAYDAFFDFVEGRVPRPPTTLTDCRGYLVATNGMMLSSGGIHDIPEEYVHTYGAEENRGYNVPGLAEAVINLSKNGGTLFDANVPWARRTETISKERIMTTDLLPYLTQAKTASSTLQTDRVKC